MLRRRRFVPGLAGAVMAGAATMASAQDPYGICLARLRRIIAEQLKRQAANVTAATRLREDLGFDDLSMVEFAMAVDNEFDALIEADLAADNWRTVGDAIRELDSKGACRR